MAAVSEGMLPNIVLEISQRGNAVLQRMEGSKLIDEEMKYRAKNLGIPLPPVHIELERLQRLRWERQKKDNTDEESISDFKMSMAPIQGKTMLGDIFCPQSDSPTHEESTSSLLEHRGICPELLAKVNCMDGALEYTSMGSELKAWVEDIVEMQKTETTEGSTEDTPPAVREEQQKATKSTDQKEYLINIHLLQAVRQINAVSEALRLVVGGRAPAASLGVFLQPLVDPPAVTDEEGTLEEAIATLKSDIISWASDVRRHPSQLLAREADKKPTGSDTDSTEVDDEDNSDSGDAKNPKKELLLTLREGADNAAPSNTMKQTTETDATTLGNDGSRGAILQEATRKENSCYADGVQAAAARTGRSLNPLQVREILQEFYNQPKNGLSSPLRKKQKTRLERRYIETLKRESEQTEKLNLVINRLKEQLEEKDKLLIQSDDGPEDSVSFGVDVKGISKKVKKEWTMVEAMSSRRVKELEAKVQEIEEDFNTVKAASSQSLSLFEGLKADYGVLCNELALIRKQWEQKEEEIKIKEKEIALLQQGRRRDDQVWRTRLLEVSRAVVSSAVSLPNHLSIIKSTLLEDKHKQGWQQDVTAELDQATTVMQTLINKTMKYAPQEGFRITLDQVTRVMSDDTNTPGVSVEPGSSQFEFKLFDQLQEKIEMLATENRSKFREARYIKSVITYVCQTVEAFISGDYGTDIDVDKPMTFPPSHVVAQDKDYAYAWLDERKMLEEVLTTLNLFVRHGGTKPNSVNSLVSVLGLWKEGMTKTQ